MIRIIAFISALMLAACDVEFQATSGAAYLAAGEVGNLGMATDVTYEPDLTFPARIGVMRLVYGRISSTPAAERTLFSGTFPSALGNVVHLGPLEVRMSGVNHRLDQHTIRSIAVSRHLDYVLVISFDPGQNSAEALFLDVRSGYPYASIETTASGRGRTNFWGGRLRNQNRIDASTLRLARHLVPDIEAMFEGLLARVPETSTD